MYQNEADLYIFPEMFLTGYGENPAGLEEDVQRALDRIRLRCMERNTAVVVGGPRYTPEGIYNTAYFIHQSGMEYYDKIHLASFGIYSEACFTPGNKTTMFEYKGIKFGLSICYDIFFPELYREYAMGGADAMICLAASAMPSESYFDIMLPGRALEELSYIVFVNNYGDNGSMKFYGRSRLVSPLGSIVGELSEDDTLKCYYMDCNVVNNARKERKHLVDFRDDIKWNYRKRAEKYD